MSEVKPPYVSVPLFYTGKSIFITGGTGFLGKVLIEKLLRSCPGTTEIFILMRPKKGLSVEERLQKMLKLPLFDKLREKDPSAFAKLIPVCGDAASEGLGLSSVDRQMLIDRVSVIFHVAASVRFDDNLRDAVFNNTRSTRDICQLAENMKNLLVLVHVSTTYSQADKPIVEEKMYPFDVDWKKTIQVVETLDPHTINVLTSKYLGPMPNTYTFTKRLAEEVISEYSHKLPCVVFRPSIVISTINDPIEGWIDNFNGPVGLMIGGGKGVLRVVLMNPNVNCDFIPVDTAIKGLLLTAAHRGVAPIKDDPSLHVYNCAADHIKSLNNSELVNMGIRSVPSVPLDGTIWAPNTTIVNNTAVYYVAAIILHFLPALFIDSMLKLYGIRPLLVRIQRKVYVSNLCLSYFLKNEWRFRNGKLLALLKSMPLEERKDYGFDYDIFDVPPYFRNCIIGAKKYLLNEDVSPETLKHKRIHFNRMKTLDKIVKILFYVMLAWVIHRSNLVSNMWESVTNFK